MGDSEDEDQYDDDDDSRKMDTVNEAGNETNQMTTEGKQPNSGSGGGLAGLRDIGELDGKQDDSDDDDEEYDDGFEEKEDYEFWAKWIENVNLAYHGLSCIYSHVLCWIIRIYMMTDILDQVKTRLQYLQYLFTSFYSAVNPALYQAHHCKLYVW